MKTIKAKVIISLECDKSLTDEAIQAHLEYIKLEKVDVELDMASDLSVDSVELLEVWVE